MEYRRHRRGFFTYDLLFAFLTLVVTLFFLFSIINSISFALAKQQNEETSMKLLLLSDQLVRRDMAVTKNGNVFSNELSIDSMRKDLSGYLQDYNVSSVTLSFDSDTYSFSGIETAAASERVCVGRIVLLSDYNEAGVLRVCIE